MAVLTQHAPGTSSTFRRSLDRTKRESICRYSRMWIGALPSQTARILVDFIGVSARKVLNMVSTAVRIPIRGGRLIEDAVWWIRPVEGYAGVSSSRRHAGVSSRSTTCWRFVDVDDMLVGGAEMALLRAMGASDLDAGTQYLDSMLDANGDKKCSASVALASSSLPASPPLATMVTCVVGKAGISKLSPTENSHNL
ncbi:hypothetical protein BDZ97DRAFT_2058860 [Flammula alnicola]|nr:hypothetical protein BDZ97DRAFT_2058860 [Flammula alnicola]